MTVEPLFCTPCQVKLEGPPLPNSIEISLDDLSAKNRSNQLPSNMETSRIHSLLEDTKKSLDQCDHTISQFELALKQLREKRATLKRLSDHAQSHISPIRKLPPEILNEIFSVVCSSGISLIRRYKASGPVFILTWVCSFWRELVLSRPALWSKWDVHLSAFHLSLDPAFIEVLVACISRSGSAALSPSLHFKHTSYVSSDQKRIVKHLCNLSSRWRSLRLDATEYALDYRLNPDLNLSSLETLRLQNTPDIALLQAWPDFRRMHPFQRCPSLRHVTCSHLYGNDPLDLSNVKTLEIGTFYTSLRGSSLPELLQGCPSLKTLELRGFVNDSRSGLDSLATVTIRHSLLSELRVAFDHFESESHAWHSIELPALTSLSVFFVPACEPQVRRLKDMLTLSGSSIKDLKLYDFPEQIAIGFFADIHTLSQLYLSQDSVSETLFSQLVLSADRRIAPELRTFSFDLEDVWSSGSTFGSSELFEEVLWRMVESRRSSAAESTVAGLQRLSLRLPYLPAPALSSIRMRFRDVEGFTLDIATTE